MAQTPKYHACFKHTPGVGPKAGLTTYTKVGEFGRDKEALDHLYHSRAEFIATNKCVGHAVQPIVKYRGDQVTFPLDIHMILETKYRAEPLAHHAVFSEETARAALGGEELRFGQTAFQLRRPLQRWCRENCKGKWFALHPQAAFEFEREEDAALFKLFWT